MLDGLRWFERYVPKRLVQRLIRLEDEAGVQSEFRDIAIMFADLVDYTTLSEQLTANQSADLLNEHFAALSKCIEAEDGVVDKFIGDSVMAIWGAPDASHGLADRAARAALAIADIMEERNKAPCDGRLMHLRIGLHLGRVVVGNIGSPERVNYTVVGDAVNVAQRLEEIGKSVGDRDRAVNTLISGEFRNALSDGYDLTDLGLRELRGRREKIHIYALNARSHAHQEP
jgi:adenylate cyclase